MRMKLNNNEHQNDSGVQKYTVPPLLKDQFGRTFNYLRIAVNEICNLRCIYCMPEEGVPFKPSKELLTSDEIIRFIKVAAGLGVIKIRFTGGEPLLRKDLVQLISDVSNIPNIQSVHLTTNGVLLEGMALELKGAGLHGINISIDTLDPDKYRMITRRDEVEKALKGLKAVKEVKIPSIKVNVVALRGFNDSEISDFVNLTKHYPLTVRFIELMPFDAHQIWKTGKFFSAKQIINDLKQLFPNIKTSIGTATEHSIFSVPGFKGKVAVIPSYSRDLCSACNRVRLTADGQIRNCLFAKNEYGVKELLMNGSTDNDIADLLLKAMWKKPIDGWKAQRSGKEHRESMTQIGG